VRLDRERGGKGGCGRWAAARAGRYRLSPDDARKVVEGVALASEIYLAAGAEVVYPMLPGVPSLSTRAEIETLRGTRFDPSELHLSAYPPWARPAWAPTRPAPWSTVGAVWDVPGLSISTRPVCPPRRTQPADHVHGAGARSAARLADSLT